MQQHWRRLLLFSALILLVLAAWRLKPRHSSHSAEAPGPAAPILQTRPLPDDLRRALASGQPVRIPLPSKDGALAHKPPADTFAPPEDIPLLPPPDPAEQQQRLQNKALDDIRTSTPEQRLERLRQLQAPQ